MSSWSLPAIQVFEMLDADFSIDLKDRLVIWAEIDKYRWKEDESVWRQKRDKDAKAYEITFDGEFVCFFDTNDTPEEVRLRALEGIRDLFNNQKIFFNKEMYAVREAKIEEQNRVEMEKPTTPEDKILTEVVKKHAKRRGKKVIIK